MNKLPDVSRGSFGSVGNAQQELFKFPIDGYPPALLYFRNIATLGSIFMKIGTDANAGDIVSTTDFQYVFLPGEEKYLDNPGSGSVLIISDQAAGVSYSFNARYTTMGTAPGANVS